MPSDDIQRFLKYLPALVCQGPRWQLLDPMQLGGIGLEPFIKKVNSTVKPLHAVCHPGLFGSGESAVTAARWWVLEFTRPLQGHLVSLLAEVRGEVPGHETMAK